MDFGNQHKVKCPVCGNDDWWKFEIRKKKFFCLCCNGKRRFDEEKLKEKEEGNG